MVWFSSDGNKQVCIEPVSYLRTSTEKGFYETDRCELSDLWQWDLVDESGERSQVGQNWSEHDQMRCERNVKKLQSSKTVGTGTSHPDD